MNFIEHVQQSWGWTGMAPVEIIGENDFGNLMIRDVDGAYWRLCPEDLYCEVVAENRTKLDALIQDPEFQQDWQMAALVQEAQARLGALDAERKYCLKIPGILGGEYGGDNLASISLLELIAASGHIAQQVADLPEGSRVSFRITD